jgi:hypothetical protein
VARTILARVDHLDGYNTAAEQEIPQRGHIKGKGSEVALDLSVSVNQIEGGKELGRSGVL